MIVGIHRFLNLFLIGLVGVINLTLHPISLVVGEVQHRSPLEVAGIYIDRADRKVDTGAIIVAGIDGTVTEHAEQFCRGRAEQVGDIVAPEIKAARDAVLEQRPVETDIFHHGLLPGHVGIIGAERKKRNV